MTDNKLALAQLRALLRGEPLPTSAAVVDDEIKHYQSSVATLPAERQAQVIGAWGASTEDYTNTSDTASEDFSFNDFLKETEAESPPKPGERKYKPRGYQIEGIARLRELKRALLWDAPGLGKTLQASEVANGRPPVLVLAPTYLTGQWFDFLCEQYPEQAICLVDGTRKEREAALAKQYEWYICNHEMMRTYADTMPHVNSLIIDEAHHFRHKDAKQSAALRRFARDIPIVLELTATPMYKDGSDVWHLLHILDPKKWPSFWTFVNTHMRTYSNGYGTKMIGVRNAAALNAEMHEHGLGRSYKDVTLELPKLITRHIAVPTTPEFMKKYNEVRLRYRYNDKDVNSLMEAMHILRRITTNLKLEHALELLQDEPEGIIFTWYTDTAKALSQILEVPHITGETLPDDRKKIVKESKLVVATMASASEGMDASHLNHAIFFEGDYVPARLYQALSRVHRLRADMSPVRATYLYVKGTIDEIVHRSAQTRNASIKSVMRQALIGVEGEE